MSLLSIVCVYNNRDVLKKCLMQSTKKQSFQNFQFVLIDNTKNTFRTMEDAFCQALTMTKGDYIAFSHQDICFLDDNVLEKIMSQVEEIENLGVAGVAGAPYSNDVPLTVSNILQGSKMENAAKYQCTSFFECQTVDECFFIVPKKIMFEYAFNKKMNWHLYAVDYCLKVKENGKIVGVLPVDGILHLSPGSSLNKSYLTALKTLFDIHPSLQIVYTTMGKWRKGTMLCFSFFVKYMKMKFKK